MKKKSLEFKGIKFLFFVIIIYIFIFFYDSQKSFLALTKSYEMILRLLPIFVMIILILTLINYFLKPKAIMKYFGKNSGLKGWLLAVISGVISHGPMYAWYPMIDELRKNDLKDGLLVTFMFTRTIKVPYIPILIDYFGLIFTVILFINILIAGVLQGLIMEAFNKK